jgi:isopenicillin-N epimerase
MRDDADKEPKAMQLPGRVDSSGLSDARAHLALAPSINYLNSGSFGPPSRRVVESVASFRSQLAQDPMDFLLRWVPPLLWHARVKFAEFLGGDPRRLLFTTNVTEAVNLIAASVKFATPGEILLSDHEYTPMRWCWERTAKRCGLDIRTFRLPARAKAPEELLDEVSKAMTPRTRLMFLSHVVSSTGLIVPVREVCELAHRHGIVTVIDGAHGPAFTSLKLGELMCDYYVGSGQKWLLAPTGTGFLYFGASRVDSVEPMQVSWGYRLPKDGQSADEPDSFGSTPNLRRLECEGTRDICPWLAVPDAIAFLAGYGSLEIWRRMRELANYTRCRLSGLSGLVAVTPDHPAMSGAMTAFAVPGGTNPLSLQRQLWDQFRVEVAVLEQGTQTIIRVSAHFFNTEAEIDQLADALEYLLGTK